MAAVKSKPTGSMARLVQIGSLLAIALGLFGLCLGAVLLYTNLQGQLATEQASRVAEQRAREITGGLSAFQRALADPQVQELAREAATRPEIGSDALTQAVRARGVSNILDLRLFPESVEEIELGAYPEPDFGVVEMLIEARRSGQASSQVQHAGSRNENLAFAQAVRDGNNTVVGLLFLRVPVSAVTSLLNDAGDLDYLALVQGRGERAIELKALGSLRRGDVRLEPIEGSQLGLRWSRSTLVGPVGNQAAVILGSLGIILLMSGLLMRRQLGKAEFARHSASAASQPSPASPSADRSVDTDPARAPSPEPAAAAVASPPKAAPPSAAKDKAKAAEQTAEPAGELPDWLLDDDTADNADAPFAGDETSAPASLPDLPDPLDDSSSSRPIAGPGSDARGQPDDEHRQQADEEPLSLFEPDEDLDLDFHSESAADDEHESGRVDEPDQSPEHPIDSQPEPESKPEPKPEPKPKPQPKPQPKPEPKPKSKPEPKQRSSQPSVIDAALFRSGQIRGQVEELLDARCATLIGQAVGAEARSRGIERIAVGRDGRLYGAVLLAALSQGLRVSGIQVIDVGAVPAPVLNFAAQELADGSGVMVTGSHYPPEINGFRIRLAGEVLHDEGIQALYQRIQNQDYSRGEGAIEEHSISERYIERIGIDVQLERSLKVVVDCANGIAGAVAPQVLSAIGADVIPLYADVDGSFPNHLPNPADPENLEDLKLCVRNFQADLGIAYDGDGDRLAVVTGNGEVVWSDRLLMLLARDLLSRQPDALVIQDAGCSAHLASLVEDGGGRILTARSADAFVAELMRRENAQLGGLMSGHLFVTERWYPFDDAIYASARLLELFAADTRSVSEILADLPVTVSTPEIRIAMDSDEAAADLVMALLAEGEFGDAKISSVDGLRAEFSHGWGLVRASHTGPELVLRFEGRDAKALNRIKTVFKDQIKARDSSLSLLF